MLKKIFFTLFLLGPFAFAMEWTKAETIGKIVAIVNDDVITQEDLEEFLREFPGKEDLHGEILLQKALDRLIENKLILQKAKELGISVSPEELEEVVRKIKNRFPTQEAFEKALLDAGLSYKAFVTRHKEQLLIRKAVSSEVRAKSRVSPREIEEYYKTHLDQFQSPESWKLSHLLIRKKTQGLDPEAKALAEQFLGRLRQGEDFASLARQYSEGPRKEEGGSLGFVERDKLMKEIVASLEALPPGSLSGIIETPAGYSLFLLEDRKEATRKGLKEVKEEIHIFLLSEKIKRRYQEWIAELKKEAYLRR